MHFRRNSIRASYGALEVWQLSWGRLLSLAAFWLVLSVLASSTGQLPRSAVIYEELDVSFPAQATPLRVAFYTAPNELAGIKISSREGAEVAGVTIPSPLGLLDGTGIHNLTGVSSHELTLIAGFGAKAVEARVYQLRDRNLVEIGQWSGFRVQILELKGRQVVAVTPTEYGTLTNLYLWKDARFVESNNLFPEFYIKEIEQQTKVIDGPDELPAYVFAQACALAARGLIYGKAYARANSLCQQALHVVQLSARVVPNLRGETLEEFSVERKNAETAIRKTIEGITRAQASNSSRLFD